MHQVDETRAGERKEDTPVDVPQLMERVVERENLRRALHQVRSNKGGPGVDGMTVEQLPGYLKEHWPEIKAQLLRGTYEPKPVKRVEIPKAGGGVRKLGIPTVVDRFIQHAVMQVLQADWDRTFSQYSFGFRPGRSAHQAVACAQEFLMKRRTWVVDIDLENFFDRASQCTPADQASSKRAVCRSNTLILNPFRFPRRTWTHGQPGVRRALRVATRSDVTRRESSWPGTP
jgi:RNA-directed DNA polymerase